MDRKDLADLNAFLVIAQEKSFTRAAGKLETSQSALSHALRRLEARLGVQLLARTTRNVALTAAGEAFLLGLKPGFAAIESSLATIRSLQESPRGSVRLTAPRHAARSVLWPALKHFVRDYPEIEIDLSVDTAFRGLAEDQFDAGIRLGELVAPNMVAVKIGPSLRMAAVAAPDYLARRGLPRTPHQLTEHNCIHFRMPSSGRLYAWEFKKGKQEIKVHADGPLTFDDPDMLLAAAVDGQGVACLIEDHAAAAIADGSLIRLLEDWCPPFPGYHLYYQTRKNHSTAFRLLVERLRFRG